MINRVSNFVAPIRRDEDLLCGRLIALASNWDKPKVSRIKEDPGITQGVSIDFPAMPDTLELARSAEYYFNYSVGQPDGMHQYMGTKPLEIPFSFRLHSMDKKYCKHGALTLLYLAARLHAFVLPISTYKRGVQTGILAPSANTGANGGAKPVAEVQFDSGKSAGNNFKVVGAADTSGIHNPVTALLHLIYTTASTPGISAIGYVRDVKVVFNGPWLRGPNNSFNLPTSADFSFLFIHRPGYGNYLGTVPSAGQFMTVSPQVSSHAFADDVKDLLYNTYQLATSGYWQGLGEQQAGDIGAAAENTSETQNNPPVPVQSSPIPRTSPHAAPFS